MNYLDAERTRYQNQDRYATRIKTLELFVQTLGSLYNQISRRYTRGRAIGELFRLNSEVEELILPDLKSII